MIPVSVVPSSTVIRDRNEFTFSGEHKSGTWGTVLLDPMQYSRALDIRGDAVRGYWVTREATKVFVSYADELSVGIVRELATYALIHSTFEGDPRRILGSGLNFATQVQLLRNPNSRLIRNSANLPTPAVLRMPMFDCSAHELSPIFDVHLLRRIATQASKGIAALHAMGIMHRDVKPGNILVSGERGDFVVISDYGLSKPMGMTSSSAVVDGSWEGHGDAGRNVMVFDAHSAEVHTFPYRAPEILMRGGEQGGERSEYGPAADMWALGMSILHMASGNHIRARTSYETLLSILRLVGNRQAQHLDWFDHRSFPQWTDPQPGLLEQWCGELAHDPAAMDFVRKLLIIDPDVRMTSREAVLHPWIREEQPGQHPGQHPGQPGHPGQHPGSAPPPAAFLVRRVSVLAWPVMDFLVSRRLMSVSAAYLAQEYIALYCDALARTRDDELVVAMASMLLAICMVDSQSVSPMVVWQAGVHTKLIDDDGSDSHDVAYVLLRYVNLIIKESRCNLWLPTLACPCLSRPLVNLEKESLLTFVLTRALPSFPTRFLVIRESFLPSTHSTLVHSRCPEASAMPGLSLLLALIPSRANSSLLTVYTQAVHAHFLQTCGSIMAALRLTLDRATPRA